MRVPKFLYLIFFVILALNGCNGGDSRNSASPTAPAPTVEPPGPQIEDKNLSHSLAAGTVIPVDLQSVIDSTSTQPGFVIGTVSRDVTGPDGKIALPKGSGAAIMIRSVGRKGPESFVDLGLYSVNVQGHQYPLSDGVRDAASIAFREDAGSGINHIAIHLHYGYPLEFRLNNAVTLR